MAYNDSALIVLRTSVFDAWLSGLRDRTAQKHILSRLARLALGHWGDYKAVGGEVLELRIHVGPGYRVYCWREGATVVVALAGGDKSTQPKDIAAARAMVVALKE